MRALAQFLIVLTLCLQTNADQTRGQASVKISGGDLLVARAAAYRDACCEILCKSLANIGADNVNEIARELSAQPSVYLRNLSVIEEGLHGDGEYRVALVAEPIDDQLRPCVGESLPRHAARPTVPDAADGVISGQRPTVAVLVSERYGTIPDAPSTLTPLLEQWLTEQGFVCVSIEQQQIASLRDQAAAILKGDTAAAKAIAGNLNAAWLLVGDVKVNAAPGLQGSDMKPHTASISARLVQADTSAVIASESVSGSCPGINELDAGREAIRRGAEKLIPRLVAAINKLLSGLHPLSGRMVIRVFGVLGGDGQQVDEAEEVMRVFAGMPSVVRDSVRVLSKQNGLLEMELRTSEQSTEALAVALSRQAVTGGCLMILDRLPRLLSLQYLGCASDAANPTATKNDGRVGALQDAYIGAYHDMQFKTIDEDRLRKSNLELVAAMKKRVASVQANDEQRRKFAALRKSLEETEATLFAAEQRRRTAAEALTTEQQELERSRDELATLTRELGEQQAANSEIAADVRAKEQSLALIVREADVAQHEVGRRQAELAGIRQRINSYGG